VYVFHPIYDPARKAYSLTKMHACMAFDPQLFYGDYDLSWRLRLCGYRLATSLKSIRYHYGSFATKSLMNHINVRLYNYQERLRVVLKNYSLKNLICMHHVYAYITPILYRFIWDRYRQSTSKLHKGMRWVEG